jgi:hypothetical protein
VAKRQISFFRAVLELFGTAFFRYPFPLNVWAVVLVGVNTASIAFLGSTEGRVIFVAALFSATSMSLLYQRLGFVRLLGTAHIYWIPMLIWLIPRLSGLEGALKIWAVSVTVIDSLSLVLDVLDSVHYIRGEREPLVKW